MSSHTDCNSKVVLRATGISAVIHNGYLVGWESERLQGVPKKPQPIQYDVVDFCQRCEKVFNSKQKEVE